MASVTWAIKDLRTFPAGILSLMPGLSGLRGGGADISKVMLCDRQSDSRGCLDVELNAAGNADRCDSESSSLH